MLDFKEFFLKNTVLAQLKIFHFLEAPHLASVSYIPFFFVRKNLQIKIFKFLFLIKNPVLQLILQWLNLKTMTPNPCLISNGISQVVLNIKNISIL
jgi:hypothetical protein